MTFLAPWALWLAAGVSAVVIGLHVLASRNPRVTPLPTTRFVPDVPLRATARALRLSDVPLLLLRVAAVMLVGLAFARPELTRARRAIGRVVLADVSRSVASPRETLDSAARLLARGDVLISFDSSAHPVRGGGADSLHAALVNAAGSRPRGSLSLALAAAMRASSALRTDADSVELVLVSPMAAEELDAATSAIRAAWPGRLRLVRVAAAGRGTVGARHVEVINAPPDDPVRATASLLGVGAATTSGTVSASSAGVVNADAALARIDRGPASATDTAWAHDRAHVLVRWPSALDSLGATARARSDTAGAIFVDDGAPTVVVSAFPRTAEPAPGRVVARWADGQAAATERAAGEGCIRDVAIPLPRPGDLALRESTRKLVAALVSPCGGSIDITPAGDSVLARLRGAGPLVATHALETRTAPPGHLATWLLSAAFALLLLEPLLRRRRASA